MATIQLPPDFKEFLRSLNSNHVEYLLVGGYAVGFHGYPRATIDLDIWIAQSTENARRVLKTIQEFGFPTEAVTEALLLSDNQMLRMGLPPVRIKVMTSVSGLQFQDCYPSRVQGVLDGVSTSIIDLGNIRKNKAASGRLKDLVDLEHLPNP